MTAGERIGGLTERRKRPPRSAQRSAIPVRGLARSGYGQGRENILSGCLLSNHICVMAGLNFEGAVVGPEIDGIPDAGDAALVHLWPVSTVPAPRRHDVATHHLRRLCASYCKFQICISLPEPVEQWEASEELVVGVSGSSNSVRTRVAIQATFLRLGGADELFPILKLFRLGFLLGSKSAHMP